MIDVESMTEQELNEVMEKVSQQTNEILIKTKEDLNEILGVYGLCIELGFEIKLKG
jgi:hypothetical protein